MPGPAFDVPVAEIIDLLVQVGDWLAEDPKGLIEQALVSARRTSPLPDEVVDRSYEHLPKLFDRESMEFQIRTELGGPDVLDGWREIVDAPTGRVHRIRAFPPRLIHVIAGNSPGVAAVSIVRGALIKGLNLIKIPSNDLFTAPAILQAMAEVAPGHPVTRSFSAVYWRGGDERVEGTLFRPQFFDKLVAWGGGDTIVNAQKYVGPGFELVAFDPKTSISLIGREAFESDATLEAVADLAAADATLVEQQACASSRFQFVEGSHRGGRPLLRAPAAAHGHRTADDQRGRSSVPDGAARGDRRAARTCRTSTGCGATTPGPAWSSAPRTRSTSTPTSARSTSSRSGT